MIHAEHGNMEEPAVLIFDQNSNLTTNQTENDNDNSRRSKKLERAGFAVENDGMHSRQKIWFCQDCRV